MKKNILTGMLCLCLVPLQLFAQDFKVNINKLTEQTQKLSESTDDLRLVWWIPTEFWETIFAQDQAINKQQADDMLATFEQYTMVAVIDGNILESGTIVYKSKEATFDDLVVIDNEERSYKPLQEDEIDSKTMNLIGIMKPILGSMLGQLGENMHFFLFQKKENPLDKIVDPKKEEQFTVKVGSVPFVWKLPLGALLQPKKCPEDGELLDGSWTFCPHHGKKLTLD